jgi:uncharacterized protein (DUF1778 family)
MAKETTYKGILGDWQRLIAALLANAAELVHLEASRLMLEQLLARALEISERQAGLRAAKQEATRELQEIIASGQRLTSILRLGAKHHYGPGSEKLTHFDVQPFRGRKRKPAEQPEVPTPAPTDPAQTP